VRASGQRGRTRQLTTAGRARASSQHLGQSARQAARDDHSLLSDELDTFVTWGEKKNNKGKEKKTTIKCHFMCFSFLSFFFFFFFFLQDSLVFNAEFGNWPPRFA